MLIFQYSLKLLLNDSSLQEHVHNAVGAAKQALILIFAFGELDSQKSVYMQVNSLLQATNNTLSADDYYFILIGIPLPPDYPHIRQEILFDGCSRQKHFTSLTAAYCHCCQN